MSTNKLRSSAYKSPELEEFGRFTRPFYKDKTVFVVPSYSPGISDITDLKGKIVAIPKGWGQEAYISDRYPDIQILTVNNIQEAFHAVINQKADASIELSGVARYLIKKNYLTGLKISGWFNEYDNNDQKALHIMVRKDWPILHQMLEKALLTTTPGDMAALEYKWLGKLRLGTDSALNLSPEEKTFVDTHPEIRVASELDWPPFDFIQNGKPAGYTLTEMIMERYPDLDYVMVKNPAEGIKQVSLGQADGFVGSLGIINHLIRQQFISNVTVAAEITLDQDLPLYMAVRKDWKILATILDKAMNQVDPLQYDAIVKKWIGSMDPAGELTTLTREEKAYLNNRKQISLCVQTDAPPFEFMDSNGEYRGMVADFYQLLSRKIGVPIQASDKGSEAGECDMISVITNRDTDPSDMQPGAAYASYPLAIATDRNALYINTLDAVDKKPIAVSTRVLFYPGIRTDDPILFQIVEQEFPR